VSPEVRGWAGKLLVFYSLIGYPALAYALGHRYPPAPIFGLPCPTTIFAVGMLLWAAPPLPRVVLVVPVLWALLGVQAVVLGVRQDAGLLAPSVIAVERAGLDPECRRHHRRRA